MSEETRGYRIHGLVQGVGFRYWTQKQAYSLGLHGYVRNLPDGSVEIAAAGAVASLADFEARLGRGPSGARVDRVESVTVPAPPPKGFQITR